MNIKKKEKCFVTITADLNNTFKMNYFIYMYTKVQKVDVVLTSRCLTEVDSINQRVMNGNPLQKDRH